MKSLTTNSLKKRRRRDEYRRQATGLLASTHNAKLGHLIHSFSIPAVTTCPGRTAICERLCYAHRGHFRQYRNTVLHEAHYEASLTDSFVGRVIHDIDRYGVRVLRVHVAGDFYSKEYADKWVEIATSAFYVRVFAYTRSWRDPQILPSLVKLSSLENVSLWFSEDRETGRSPYLPGVRVAFMVTSTLDETVVPDYADLVFRDPAHVSLYDNAVKYIGDTLVCPYEQGNGGPRKAEPVTCSTCRLCWKDDLMPQRRAPVE